MRTERDYNSLCHRSAMRTESFIVETIGLQCVQRETIIIIKESAL